MSKRTANVLWALGVGVFGAMFILWAAFFTWSRFVVERPLSPLPVAWAWYRAAFEVLVYIVSPLGIGLFCLWIAKLLISDSEPVDTGEE